MAFLKNGFCRYMTLLKDGRSKNPASFGTTYTKHIYYLYTYLEELE